MAAFHVINVNTLRDVQRRAELKGASPLATRRAKLAAIRLMADGHKRSVALAAALDVLAGVPCPMPKGAA
jgi:hypothetical protein